MRKRATPRSAKSDGRAAAHRHVTLAIDGTTPDNDASSQAGKDSLITLPTPLSGQTSMTAH